jgi:5-methylcytosine-specific restriction enzyme subunit McrC
MANNTINIFEYEPCRKLKGSQALSDTEKNRLIEINDRLKTLLKADTDIITVLHGDRLRTYHYVGVLQVGKRRIQILPKLYRSTGEDESKVTEALRNLHFMLKYTMDLRTGETPVSLFKKGDILEIYINMFLAELEKVLQSSIFKEYITVEENLSTVRGKLLLAKHIKSNAARNLPLAYCQFDELTWDNLINQTIKYTLKLLRVISQSYENHRKIDNILFIFDDISDVVIQPYHQNKIHFNRLNIQFKPVIDKCFMFIGNFSVDLTSGRFEYGGIVFDMNKLFEEFIGRIIKKHKKDLGLVDYQIELQYNIGNLDKHEDIIPKADIAILKNSKIHMIIDTKYKIDHKEKIKPSNQDIYQMIAYGIAGKCPEIVLLYPKPYNYSETSEKQITIPLHSDECHVNCDMPRELKIHVKVVDLMKENLKKSEKEIIKDLKHVVEPITNY